MVRTELQKNIGKIVRDDRIAAWQKCEKLEDLFYSQILNKTNEVEDGSE